MPKIATGADYGPRPSLKSKRPVVADQSGLIIGEALVGMGRQATQVGAAVEESQNDFKYQLAKSNALELDFEIQRAVEELPDFNTWEPEYNERMTVARQELIESLGSPRDQVLFGQELDLMTARGSGAVYAAAFKKEVSWGVGKLNDRLIVAREQYITASTPGERAELMKNALGLIDGAVAQGYIEEHEASELRYANQQDFAVSYVGMLGNSDKQAMIAMLSNPEGTPAQYIPADKRDKMRETALEDGKEELMLINAQQSYEKHSRPGQSYRVIEQLMNEGVYGKQREVNLKHLDQRRNMDFINMQETYQRLDDTLDKNEAAIRAGEPFRNFVSEADEDSFDENFEVALRDKYDKLAQGDNAHKPAVWVSLVRIARDTPDDFMKMDPMAYKPYLDELHFGSLVTMWGNARSGDMTDSAAMGMYEKIITDYAGGVPETRTDEGLRFNEGMWKWVFEQKAENGVWPSETEAMKEAGSRSVTVYIERPGGLTLKEWQQKRVEIDYMEYEDIADTGRIGMGELKTRDLYPIPAFSLRHNENFFTDIATFPEYVREPTKEKLQAWLGPLNLKNESDQALIEEVFILVHHTPRFSYYEMPKRIRQKIEASFPEDDPFDRKNSRHLDIVRQIFLSDFRL